MKHSRIHFLCVFGLLACALLVSASPVRAQGGSTLIWTDGSDVWQSPTAWNGAPAFPGSGDNAFFTNGTTYSVTLIDDVLNIQSNFFSNASGTVANVTLNLGTNELNAVYSGTSPGAFVLADKANSTTIVYLASSTVVGKGLVVPARIVIGRNGSGIMFVTNGNVSAATTIMANGTGGRGTLVLSGSSVVWSNSGMVLIGNAQTSTANNNSLVISNSATMIALGAFRVGAVSTNNFNTLLLDTGGQLFTKGLSALGGNVPTSNNTATVQGGAIWDNGGTQTFSIGLTNVAINNVLSIGTDSAVSNIGMALIYPTNTLNLLGGTFGAITTTNNGVIQGFGTLSGGLFNSGFLFATNGALSLNSTASIIQDGTITVSSGGTFTLTSSQPLEVGYVANTTGTVWVTGGQLDVTGAGGETDVGFDGVGRMTISNGTLLASNGNVELGFDPGSQGTLTVAGGQLDVTGGEIDVGFDGVGQMTISSGAALASVVLVGADAGQGTLTVAGGSLVVTNGGQIGVIQGSMAINGGTVTVDNLTCGAAFSLGKGTLNTKSTSIINGSVVIIGDGINVAELHFIGGVHSFANGLRIRNNALLTGCGTISGNVLVDAGGTMQADCGTTLNFNGTVTNSGAVTAINGTVLNFSGPVVNNGTIDATGGNVHFSSNVVNNGTILTPSTNSWTGGNGKWETSTNWSRTFAPSTIDVVDLITNGGNKIVTIDATTSIGFPNSLTINNLVISAPPGSTNTLYLSNNTGLGTNALVNPGFEADAVSNDVSCGGMTPITGWSLGGMASYSNVDSGGPANTNACYPVHDGIGALAEVAEETPPVVYQSFAVTPGQVWSMTGYGYICQTICNVTPSSDFRGLLKIVWNDSNGNPIPPVEDSNLIGGVDGAPYYGITSAPQLTNASAPDTWTFLQCQGTAPAGCVTGLFFNITVGSAGVCLFDDDSAFLATRAPLDILNGLTIGTNGAMIITNSILRVDSLSGGELAIDGGLVVCDGGSVITTNNATYVGYFGAGQMTLSNGTVLAGNVYVPASAGSQGTLTVAGGTIMCQSPDFILGVFPSATGTVWITGGEMDVTNALPETVVGDLGFGALTLSNGTVRACNLVVGRSGGSGVVNVNGGAMLVTNCSGVTEVRSGSVMLSGGELATDSLILTNVNGSFVLEGGLLICQSSIVSNGQVFTIGSNSTFQADGGIQSFANDLVIQTNSAGSGTLSGSGTIAGNVVNQGNVEATGGTTLNFTGSVGNHGNIIATGGTVLRFYGPVLNTSLIDASGGDVQFFSGVNNVGPGVVLTPTNSWTDGSDKWETSTNWSHGTAPSSTDDADLITNAGNNTVTIDATTAGSFPGTMTIRNLTIAGAGNSTNTLALTDAGFATPLHLSGQLSLSNNGVIVVDNSAVQVAGGLSVGSFGSNNRLILTNGGQLVSTTAGIGGLSGFSNNSVVVTGSNSLWSSDGMIQVGNGGSGDSLTIADGATLIASNASHTAQVLVNGATIFLGTGTFKPDNLVVTNGGSVQYTQTYQVDNANVTVASGTVQAGSNYVVAASANSTGTVAVTTGGALTVTNGVLAIGNDGTVTSGSGIGSMTVSDGATVTASTILLGSSAGGQGDIILGDGGEIDGSGTNCILVCNDFSQIGGTLGWTNIGSTFYCGYAHPGAYALSNGTSSCQDVYVGYDNTGSMTIVGGTMNILSRLIVGNLGSPMSTGAVWMVGGQLTIASYSIIGNSGVGQMTISNGTVTATDIFIGESSNPATLTLAGGTLTVNGIVVPNPNSQFVFSGGSLIAKAITNANGQAVTVGNAVGLATLSLTGGTSSLGNGLNVLANATLMGSGAINGNVVNNGFIVSVGGPLIFNGLVTNNGVIITNGVSFLGGLVNHGAILDAAGDADGDGMNNLSEVLAGTNPTNSASLFHITAVTRIGNDVQVSWSTVGGKSYVVQASTGAGGNYPGSFADISPMISAPGSGESITTYLDPGGATYIPTRYYRVRLVP